MFTCAICRDSNICKLMSPTGRILWRRSTGMQSLWFDALRELVSAITIEYVCYERPVKNQISYPDWSISNISIVGFKLLLTVWSSYEAHTKVCTVLHSQANLSNSPSESDILVIRCLINMSCQRAFPIGIRRWSFIRDHLDDCHALEQCHWSISAEPFALLIVTCSLLSTRSCGGYIIKRSTRYISHLC